MAIADNPLSLVYDALWGMLEDHAALAAIVKVGNRVKYDRWLHAPIKDVVGDADVPEVGIVPVGSSYGMQQTSNGTRLTESYLVILVTGDQRLAQSNAFLSVKWELLRAMLGWETHLKPLTWDGNTFVVVCKAGDVTDDLFDFQRTGQRGIMGWTSILKCTVEMWFRTSGIEPT